ncbi:hypothetical protein F5B20DRAFT_528331 [Whalleya microplaca]|nr:hypothetical protein F5B20DRAFT_528331 [Whalleya microplaca]
MYIEADCIISSESYDKFGVNDRRRKSNERVQDFLDRGLMHQDAVYHRYTKVLWQAITTNRPKGSSEWKSIRQAFHQLRDPETAYLSRDKFKRLMTENLSKRGLAESSEGATLLFDILSYHAFFPFPASHTDSGIPCIDEKAFLRAVCLLMRDPAPPYSPGFSALIYTLCSGTWGPHDGWLVARRGKDASDLLRRLFRSLAVPHSTGASTGTTIIPVPRFLMYQPRQGEHHSEEDDPHQQAVVVEDESERSIDIQDILSECPPEVDPLTASPLRESYGIVLPSLPLQPYDLTRLRVPTVRLMALLNLLHAVQERSEQNTMLDLITSVESLDNEGDLDCDAFDTVMSKEARLIIDTLSRIFKIFKTPLDAIDL